MAPILRGEIRWADLEPVHEAVGNEQAGSRPVLILSSNEFNHRLQLAIVVSVTSRETRYPYGLKIESVVMPQPSWILTGQIRTLSVDRIGSLVNKLPDEDISDVVRALLVHIGP